jgi:hypothetical protein
VICWWWHIRQSDLATSQQCNSNQMKKGETEINNDNDNNTKIEIEHNIGNLKRQEISQELGMLD